VSIILFLVNESLREFLPDLDAVNGGDKKLAAFPTPFLTANVMRFYGFKNIFR
jgi:hypothetical protein